MTTSPPRLGGLARAGGSSRPRPAGESAGPPAPGGGAPPAPPSRPPAPPSAAPVPPRGDPLGHGTPLGPARLALRELGLALVATGVVVLAFAGYQLFGTGIAEARSQHQLRHQFDQVVAATGPAPTPAPAPATAVAPAVGVPSPAPPAGDAVAHLVIPRIGVDKFVVGGTAVADLRKGPGHYAQTPLPGQPGNAAVAGHRTTYGAPFYRLNELRPGDDIYVTTGQGRFHYTVFQTEIVKPTQVSVLAPTPDNRLTLTTCNPRFSAATRLVVVSRLAEPAAPAAGAGPVAATGAAPGAPAPARSGPATTRRAGQVPANLGGGDGSAWPPTLFFGALILALWAGVRVRAAHAETGRRLRPYILGMALSGIPLWFLFANVIRLLPANM